MTRPASLMLLAASLLAAPLGAADWEAVRAVEIARLRSYTEGVVIDDSGDLYVSHADRISKVTPRGEISEWARTPSPNGHKIRPGGKHLVCDRKGAVYLISADGRIERRLAALDYGANDIALDPGSGGFYFSSPYASQTEPKGTLYYLSAYGELKVVAENLGFPNGVVLRPDGRALLVGESLYNRILEFPLRAPGEVGPSRVFAELPSKGVSQLDNKPDGIAFGADGNLYAAHYGMGQVQVLDPQGKLLASLPTGAVFTSNVAFGGPRGNQLYVTGSIGPTEQTAGVLLRLDLPW